MEASMNASPSSLGPRAPCAARDSRKRTVWTPFPTVWTLRLSSRINGLGADRARTPFKNGENGRPVLLSGSPARGSFSAMSLRCMTLAMLLSSIVLPAAAQRRGLRPDPRVGTSLDKGLGPLAATPDQERRYADCMRQARGEPL